MAAFRFKQFEVEHEVSSMKVGTDAVLLGILVPISSARRVLEVGVGCGVVSLLIAQRNQEARIHGIDIDAESVAEASANFAQSPWAERLSATEMALQDLSLQEGVQFYDAIVSNPPFFSHSLKSPNCRRTKARHTDNTLSFEELLVDSRKLLAEDGTLTVILPYAETGRFLQLSEHFGYALCRKDTILSKPNKPERVILTLKHLQPLVETCLTHLCMRNEKGDFTEEFKLLVEPYYIN